MANGVRGLDVNKFFSMVLLQESTSLSTSASSEVETGRDLYIGAPAVIAGSGQQPKKGAAAARPLKTPSAAWHICSYMILTRTFYGWHGLHGTMCLLLMTNRNQGWSSDSTDMRHTANLYCGSMAAWVKAIGLLFRAAAFGR